MADTKKRYVPKVVAFVCNWCSSASGDLVGPVRTPYKGITKIVRVICSGRILADNILEALEMGADGVFIAGCAPLECNYRTGNLIAQRRVHFAKNLLQFAGFDPSRVELSLGFLQLIADPLEKFRQRVNTLGPMGTATTENLTPEETRHRVCCARKVTSDPEIGWLVGKEPKLTISGNTYNETISADQFDAMILNSIEDKYKLYHVLSTIEKVPMTIPQIAAQANMPEPLVFSLVQHLEHKGMVHEAGMSGRYFQYIQA
jgi:F420-non-reducing hydrogenase iron-sulfur subunit